MIVGDIPIKTSGRGVKQRDPLSDYSIWPWKLLCFISRSLASLSSSVHFNQLVYVDDTTVGSKRDQLAGKNTEFVYFPSKLGLEFNPINTDYYTTMAIGREKSPL